MTPRLRIKMYRHGLGDCLLLRFSKGDSDDTFNVLIDCGLISVAQNPKETMTKVAEDIKKSCKNIIDIVVMTHEHWDHASGFSEQQVKSIFDQIDIKEVWYAWTEDPQNQLGMKLRNERAEKVKALASATRALTSMAANPLALERAKNLNAMLGFFGFEQLGLDGDKPIGKTRKAFEYLKERKGVKTKYCYPEQPPASLQGVDNVRVFVLGPPQNEVLIKKSAPSKKDSQVYDISSEPSLAANLMPAFDRLNSGNQTKDDCPFDASFNRMPGQSMGLNDLISKTWDANNQDWRKIELDWTQTAETLALNLDTHTNNTCLVLAFQFVDSGDVFLFPADAQVGNWLSWQDRKWLLKDSSGQQEITGTDLLNKTVFYKVGHHGSHNATLKTFGLEQMTSEDLIAFIPIVKEQAEKNRWMEMPFMPLVKRLEEKTSGRLLLSDQNPPNKDRLANLSPKTRAKFLKSLKTDKLFFEYSFE